MAARIQISPRRQRPVREAVAEVTPTSYDESALLDAADQVVEAIDAAIDG